jgi:hypothetical protein
MSDYERDTDQGMQTDENIDSMSTPPNNTISPLCANKDHSAVDVLHALLLNFMGVMTSYIQEWGHENVLIALPTQWSQIPVLFDKDNDSPFLGTSNAFRTNSLNAKITALNNFCRFLGCKKPDIESFEREQNLISMPLSETEAARVASVAKRLSSRDQFLLRLIMNHKIRPFECFHLNIDDVRFSDSQLAIIRVRAQARSSTKGWLSLTSIESDILANWLNARAKYETLNSEALFLTRNSTRMTTAAMKHLVRTVGWKARVVLSSRRLIDTSW